MGGYATDVPMLGEMELARAWPRFWARIFDVTLYSLIVGMVLGLLFPSLFMATWLQGRAGGLLLGVLLLPVIMIVDAAVIAWAGTSLGKAIAGLRVRDLNNQKLTLENSLSRNVQVYLKGMVLGLPLLCLIGYSNGFNEVRDGGITSWDEDTETRVVATDPSEWRTFLIGALGIGAIVLDRALAATL